MAGFDNDVLYCIGERLEPSTAQAITLMQQASTDVARVNFTGTPEGAVAANPSSLSHDPVSGIVYVKATGTGNTGWIRVSGLTLTGNSGGAISPSGGNWNIVTANATPRFVGSGSTLTQDFSLPNLALGVPLTSITSGAFNVVYGTASAPGLTSASTCTIIGHTTAVSLSTGGNNIVIGAGAFVTATSSAGNIVIGSSSIGTYSGSGGNNLVVGNTSLGGLQTGVRVTVLGHGSAGNYTGAESDNLIIGSGVTGTTGESHVGRIGLQGTGTNQIDRIFIAGQLNGLSGRSFKITTPGAYPYTMLTTDHVIIVDTSSARTINLIATPVNTPVVYVKDNTGSAGANNITVQGNGKNIDGAASNVISTNFGSRTYVYNGTQWNVL